MTDLKDSAEWDSPTNWHHPHTNIGGIGGFIAHADQKGRLLIEDPDSGRVQCISPPRMQRLLDEVEEVSDDD